MYLTHTQEALKGLRELIAKEAVGSDTWGTLTLAEGALMRFLNDTRCHGSDVYYELRAEGPHAPNSYAITIQAIDDTLANLETKMEWCAPKDRNKWSRAYITLATFRAKRVVRFILSGGY